MLPVNHLPEERPPEERPLEGQQPEEMQAGEASQQRLYWKRRERRQQLIRQFDALEAQQKLRRLRSCFRAQRETGGEYRMLVARGINAEKRGIFCRQARKVPAWKRKTPKKAPKESDEKEESVAVKEKRRRLAKTWQRARAL
jgi:hypothetical protein